MFHRSFESQLFPNQCCFLRRGELSADREFFEGSLALVEQIFVIGTGVKIGKK